MADESPRALEPEAAERAAEELSAAAGRLGVELDCRETADWLLALSAAERGEALAQDERWGVFGHRVALIDFDPEHLAFLRRLAGVVRAERRPGVEAAIAIAGSSAQGRVQLFPGDADFFERVNIRAASAAEAGAVLRELLRATALRAFEQPDVVLIEVNFGVYPVDVRVRARQCAAGAPITWQPDDMRRGYLDAQMADGAPLRIHWDAVPAGEGWTYVGWVVADRPSGRLVLASNMLDVTWEDGAGVIRALDGTIDPFFQEIYLELADLPVFTKITRQAAPGGLQAYAQAMRGQARHYTHEAPNYGKAAKRLYNLFRLTDQLEAAAYVRELFDEPGAQLYQLPGVLEAANLARDPASGIDAATVVRQIDAVIQAVIGATEKPVAAALVAALLRLRDGLTGWAPAETAWEQILPEVSARCNALVNEYFQQRLLGMAAIAAYVETLRAEAGAP